MTKLIFLFVIFSTQSQSFDQSKLDRDLDKYALGLVRQAKTSENYQTAKDFLLDKQRLSQSCKIELRDRLDPKNCGKLLKIWEKRLNTKDDSSTATLLKIKNRQERLQKVNDYILERNSQDSWHEE